MAPKVFLGCKSLLGQFDCCWIICRQIGGGFDDPKELFQTFVQRLYTGTIGENGLDPSGLYWLPIKKKKTVKEIVFHLSSFSDWMTEKYGSQQLNPWRDATNYEEMLNWAAWHHKHNRAFLAHAWPNQQIPQAVSKARSIWLKPDSQTSPDGAKRFPDERIMDLLFEGFINYGNNSRRIEERLNLRNILIAILMHFGGVRMSEPFHLYVHDVLQDPCHSERALVRIYHPSDGQAPDDWIGVDGKPVKCNREAYLRGKFGMRPRNQYYSTSQMHAGWKGNALDSKFNFINIHWFPSWGGELFFKLWKIYLVKRALLDCDHPFAFVTKTGKPYSPNSFEKAYARAVKRIGLVAGKDCGTSPHGHRHAYGQRMKDSDIDPVIRMRAMHHTNIESQLVYTLPQVDEVTQTLNKAAATLNNGDKLSAPNFLKYGFQDVDPLGLFSGLNPKLKRG